MILKKSELEILFDQIFGIEMRATIDVVKQAKKDKNDEQMIMGHSFIMGLQRGRDMLQIVLQGLIDDKN